MSEVRHCAYCTKPLTQEAVCKSKLDDSKTFCSAACADRWDEEVEGAMWKPVEVKSMWENQSLEDQLRDYVASGRKIEAIRIYRQLHPVTLHQAIEAVDKMLEDKPTYEALQRRIEDLEAENKALQWKVDVGENHLNGILNELRAIEDQIPFNDKAKLPGTPTLTDCMKSLLAQYQETQQQLETERKRADFAEREFRDMSETLQNAIKVWRVDDKVKGFGADNVDDVIIQYVNYLHNECASLRTMARWLDTRE